MTSPADFRARLESLLGTVHTADRAADALGCTSRAVEYWFAGDRPVPLWAVRHLETAEMVAHKCETDIGIGRFGLFVVPRQNLLPECWWQKPPPP